MNGTEDKRILAIARDNRVAHLYNNAGVAANSQVNIGETVFPMEFFDIEGFRMMQVTDGVTGVKTLKRSGAPAPDLVLSRLSEALQKMGSAAAQISSERSQRSAERANNAGGLTKTAPLLDESPIPLPDLTGLTLAEAFDACNELLNHNALHTADQFHNWIVHGILGQ